jgi:hypothetical protein
VGSLGGLLTLTQVAVNIKDLIGPSVHRPVPPEALKKVKGSDSLSVELHEHATVTTATGSVKIASPIATNASPTATNASASTTNVIAHFAERQRR